MTDGGWSDRLVAAAFAQSRVGVPVERGLPDFLFASGRAPRGDVLAARRYCTALWRAAPSEGVWRALCFLSMLEHVGGRRPVRRPAASVLDLTDARTEDRSPRTRA